jgi:hypothetical protein
VQIVWPVQWRGTDYLCQLEWSASGLVAQSIRQQHIHITISFQYCTNKPLNSYFEVSSYIMSVDYNSKAPDTVLNIISIALLHAEIPHDSYTLKWLFMYNTHVTVRRFWYTFQDVTVVHRNAFQIIVNKCILTDHYWTKKRSNQNAEYSLKRN